MPVIHLAYVCPLRDPKRRELGVIFRPAWIAKALADAEKLAPGLSGVLPSFRFGEAFHLIPHV
jgi:hypothetical protein